MGQGLTAMAVNGLLPTPIAQGEEKYETLEKRKGHKTAMSHLEANMQYQTGHHSQQLNPQFVAEMMGYPPDWTVLPFQNGETNQSKATEMP